MKSKDKESAAKKAKDFVQVDERTHKEAARKADAAEEVSKQAKSALKQAKKEFKVASKSAREARNAADEARSAYNKAAKRSAKAEAKLGKSRKKAARWAAVASAGGTGRKRIVFASGAYGPAG